MVAQRVQIALIAFERIREIAVADQIGDPFAAAADQILGFLISALVVVDIDAVKIRVADPPAKEQTGTFRATNSSRR